MSQEIGDTEKESKAIQDEVEDRLHGDGELSFELKGTTEIMEGNLGEEYSLEKSDQSQISQQICEMQEKGYEANIKRAEVRTEQGPENAQASEQQPRSRTRKRCSLNLHVLQDMIILCGIIVLLIQILMCISFYNQLYLVHEDVKGISCAIYGKNCPDIRTAYQCLTNKVDYTNEEHARGMEFLRRDMNELLILLNNLSDTIQSTNNEKIIKVKNEEEEDDYMSLKKPPRSGSIYVNP